MNKVKRITALLGAVILLSLYILSLVSSLLAKPYARGLFFTSIFATIAIPIFIYGATVVYRVIHKNDDGISIRDLKKRNKQEMKREKHKIP